MLRELSGLGVYPPACKTQHEYLDALRKYQTVTTLKTEITDFTLVFAWLCVLSLFFFSCSSLSYLCWVLVGMRLCITLFFYEPRVFCVHIYKPLNGYRRTKGENVVHSGLMTSSSSSCLTLRLHMYGVCEAWRGVLPSPAPAAYCGQVKRRRQLGTLTAIHAHR